MKLRILKLKTVHLSLILLANLFFLQLPACVTAYINDKTDELHKKCELRGLKVAKEYKAEECTVIPGEKLVFTFDNLPGTNSLNFKIIFDGKTVFGPKETTCPEKNRTVVFVPDLNIPSGSYVALVFTDEHDHTVAVYRTDYRKMLIALEENGNIKIIPLLNNYTSADQNNLYEEITNDSGDFTRKHIRISPSGRYFVTGIYSFESTADSTVIPASVIPTDIDIYSLPLRKKIFTVTNSAGLDSVAFIESSDANTGKIIIPIKNTETNKWKPVVYDLSDETSITASSLQINEQQGFDTPPLISAGKNFYAVASSDDFSEVLTDHNLQKGDGSFTVYSFTDDASRVLTCNMSVSSERKFVRSLYIFDDANGNEVVAALCLNSFLNENFPDSFKVNLNYTVLLQNQEELPETKISSKDTTVSSLPVYWSKTSDLDGNSKISPTIRALKNNIFFHSFELNSYSSGCSVNIREFPKINTNSMILAASHYNGTETTIYWFENSEISNSEERKIISNANNTLIIKELNKPYKAFAGFSDNKTAVLTNNAIVVLTYSDLLDNIPGEVIIYGNFTGLAVQ